MQAATQISPGAFCQFCQRAIQILPVGCLLSQQFCQCVPIAFCMSGFSFQICRNLATNIGLFTRGGGGGAFSYGYVPTWCSNPTLSKIFLDTKILPCLKYQHEKHTLYKKLAFGSFCEKDTATEKDTNLKPDTMYAKLSATKS